MDDVKIFYQKEITLGKLLKIEVFDKVSVTDKDIERYYEQNLDLFKIPESVNVSHILICHNESLRCVSNLTKEEAKQKALLVRSKINKTNFAQIAYEYSDEPGAKETYGNLDWVSIEDPFDQTFMNATFALATGEVSKPVETVFGYHIIKVFEKKQEQQLNVSVVTDQINQTLSGEKQQELFSNYLSQVRNNSVVINFMEETG
jgi:parvulin-like peptidyl-prolyl isomerase